MKFLDFREKFNDFAVFSLADIRKGNPLFRRALLNEWQEKAYITKLRRGFYAFAGRAHTEATLALIAHRLYVPSYISMESALSLYGLIPEGVYSVTSVTSRKTARFATPIATFGYRRVKPSAFFGYHIERTAGQGYALADIEKAVLDYLYFHPTIVTDAAFHEWRFASDVFLERMKRRRFLAYARAFGSASFVARADVLLATIDATA